VAQIEQGLGDPDGPLAGTPRVIEQLLRAGLSADPRRRPSLTEFVTELRGRLNQLLADSLRRIIEGSVCLRLSVSRQTGAHNVVPVTATHSALEPAM